MVFTYGLMSDNYFCRSATIRIAGCCRPDGARDHLPEEDGVDGDGCAGQGDEAEANGWKDAGDSGSRWGHERADGPGMGKRVDAVAEQADATLANARGSVRDGLGQRSGTVAH